MSTHLKYSKDAKIGFEGNFFNDKDMSKAEQAGFIYDTANDFRDRFKPVFANETKYLPNVKGSELVSSDVKRTDLPADTAQFPSAKSLTVPPHKKAEDIIKFMVVGGALFLVYKIITD